MMLALFICFLSAIFFVVYALIEQHKARKEYENLKTMVRLVNHEMKNSLTALQFADDEETRQNEIKRLAELTNSTGSFIQNPKGEPSKIDLVSLLKELSKIFSQKVKCSSDGESRYVMFDLERARSVFENLIKNACESADGKNAHVEVSIEQVKNKVVVRVKDRGKGFALSESKKMFNLNYTTKKHGSGIGLYLSKIFVEAQKGSLKLYPREGGGAVAEVILPVWREK